MTAIISMPYHYQAVKTTIKEVANIDLALEILKIKGDVDVKNIMNKDIQISEIIAKRKKELFKQLCVIPKPFVGVKKLIISTLSGCSKAVVSGSAKDEVDTIIQEIFGIDAFDVIINGDQFEGNGKPDPASFEVALQRLNVKHPDAVVISREHPAWR